MSKTDTPDTARISLQAGTAAVCRHGPNGEVDVLCLATRLENGIWGSVRDRGIYGDKVRGQTRGTLEVVDLHLHTLEDDRAARRVLPIRWATQTPVDPIVLLGVPGDEGLSPFVVPSSELVAPEYQHIHVPAPRPLDGDTFSGPRNASAIDMSQPIGAQKGSIFGHPMLQSYRDGMSDGYRADMSEDHRDEVINDARRRRTICVHADMGRPHDSLLGAPVVESSGRLAGIVVGAGQGFQYDHVGAYVPADMLQVFIQLAKAQWAEARQRGRHSHGIDLVSHESTDVYFEEADRVPTPRSRMDQPIKVVMTRRRFTDIIAATEIVLSGAGGTIDTKRGISDVETSLKELRSIIGD